MINPEVVMQLCIAKAFEFKGKTKRNPTVGAAVVKDNKIIEVDAHKFYGGKHAEVNVLQKVGSVAKDADLYVTLEPCATYGKMPPCINSIIDAGIKRVFIGVIDPNPLNSGKGFKALRDNHIETYVGFEKKACAELIEDFTKSIVKNSTYNIIKIAQSLDGKIATNSRDSRWITGNTSREYAHYLRSTCDGILIGINTVLHDNPQLDVRLKDYVESGPKKIVLDTYLKIDEKCKLIEMYRKDLIIFTGKNIEASKKDKLLSMGISIYECNTNEKNFINIKEVLETLLGLNILRVLIEGGSTVHGTFLDNNDIDHAYFFIAPIIIGGQKAISSIDGEGVSLIKDAHKLKNLHHQYFENDFLIDGKLNDYSSYVLEQTDKISNLCSQV